MVYHPKRQVLYKGKYLTVVKLDGWFEATEPTNSMYNMAVAVLPYRRKKTGVEFLARLELNPAHMVSKYDPQVSIITGACETGDPRYHARMELLEEGGYDICEDRLFRIGVVTPIKSSRTLMNLFTVRIIGKDKQKTPEGDGGPHEIRESVEWVDYETMLWAKDPYIHTIIMRLNARRGGKCLF